MIREAERLGRPRDVPIVVLERVEHDLPFGLRLQRLERPGQSRRVSALVSFLASNLWWNIGRTD